MLGGKASHPQAICRLQHRNATVELADDMSEGLSDQWMIVRNKHFHAPSSVSRFW